MDQAQLFGVGRAAVGVAVLAAPKLANTMWFGDGADTPAAQILLKMFGIREVFAGAALAAAPAKGTGRKALLGLGIAVDAVDGWAFFKHSEALLPGKKAMSLAVPGAAVAAQVVFLAKTEPAD